MTFKYRMLTAASALCLSCLPVWAEEAEETFIITASPLAGTQAETAAAVTVVTRDEIIKEGAATLGELLDGLPGVHQSSFAAGASRPIIRGLDNTRVRIQENGVATGDVSVLSEDHGVAIDPLAAQRVEIVRGPAVLRYGSEAIGGIVNILNDRIPTSAPEGGFAAETFVIGSSVDGGVQAGGLVDAGGENFAIHADAFWRDAGDHDTPRGTQERTWTEQVGASVGGSLLSDNGHIGAAVSHFVSEYGIPAGEGEIYIDMQQTRLQVSGGVDGLAGPITELRFSGGLTDYTHDEIDLGTGDVGSTFDNDEGEVRAEVLHARFGPFTGAFGVQARARDLSASGEGGELLAPSNTRMVGAYLFEQIDVNPFTILEFAGRVEHVEHEGTAFRPVLPNGMEFNASRDFMPISGSAAAVFNLGHDVSFSATAQIVQRAPDVLELFAKGPHEATETFEIGNPDLSLETARGLEVMLERTQGPIRFELAGYTTWFDDFIFKAFTGVACGEEFDTCGIEDELTQIRYDQDGVTFTGFEASAVWDVLPIGPDGMITLDAMADHVRAELDSGGNVPRIPPFRYGGGITYENSVLTLGANFLHVGEQDDLAPFESPTDAYTTVSARAIYRFDMPNTDTPFELGLVASNLLDEEARNHTSFKKDDVLLPGRNIRIFVRAQF